ncbi:unnamed protein product [Rotaria sp. Silwood1]|nr:unnamed protein product [Rotaria sp. Silwood1]CAF3453850.1 unnamed protein product [Rotaria sp. Silwood1]CAF3491588.1 unnamed protein product [Rotaria sp. Silwood1]CAF4744752.1 unnamed protein product [Rotaria sp. Silwood1]CAF4844841.1 unnamed protein product [Rotaria sp. Silwood1]
MFHIFRWRRERKDDKRTTSDPLVSEEYKIEHARQRRSRKQSEIQHHQTIFHTKKTRSSSDNDKYQVVIN